MRAALVAALYMIVVLGGPAAAQDGAAMSETRCLLGSVSFSAGASMSVGNGVATCEGDDVWQATASGSMAAGCLLEGKLSSVGAVVGISNNDALSLQCGSDGTWATLAASPSGD